MAVADARAISTDDARIAGLDGRATRVLIFGDQRLLADSIGVLLEQQVDMHVIGNTPWQRDSPAVAAALDPDVVVIDFHLHDRTAADAAIAIWRAGSTASIVFVTPREMDACLIAALEVGASAVVDARRPASELIATVRTVSHGDAGISAAELARLLRRRRVDVDTRRRVTSRELEVLNLLARGLSSREIASSLRISYVTVRTHLRNLAGKLTAHNKIQVLTRARECGLLDDMQVHGLFETEDKARATEVDGSPRRARRRHPARLVIPPIEARVACA